MLANRRMYRAVADISRLRLPGLSSVSTGLVSHSETCRIPRSLADPLHFWLPAQGSMIVKTWGAMILNNRPTQGVHDPERSHTSWCKRRGIRRRYGRIGEPASIAIVERFIRSMKNECTRIVVAPLTLAGMRRELGLYAGWYNTHRPHMALGGKTPLDLVRGNLRRRKRFEPRSRLPRRSRDELETRAPIRLAVSYVERRRHLPVITLERAA